MDRIENLTNEPAAAGPINWDNVLRLCDLVNNQEDGAKDAVKVIRKRLRSKQAAVNYRSLEVLQMLFDNCGPRLYGSFLYSCAGLMSESEGLVQIASQKFLEDLQSLFKNPQLDPFVRDKILQLLGQWTETLKNQPGFQEIEALHKSLSSQAQNTAWYYQENRPIPTTIVPTTTPTPVTTPIHAPAASVPTPLAHSNSMPVKRVINFQETVEVGQNVSSMLSESIAYLNTEEVDITKNELIQDLYVKGRQIQNDLTQLISTEENDEKIAELLSLNQQILNSFHAYDEAARRFSQNKQAGKQKDEIPASPVSMAWAGFDYDQQQQLLYNGQSTSLTIMPEVSIGSSEALGNKSANPVLRIMNKTPSGTEQTKPVEKSNKLFVESLWNNDEPLKTASTTDKQSIEPKSAGSIPDDPLLSELKQRYEALMVTSPPVISTPQPSPPLSKAPFIAEPTVETAKAYTFLPSGLTICHRGGVIVKETQLTEPSITVKSEEAPITKDPFADASEEEEEEDIFLRRSLVKLKKQESELGGGDPMLMPEPNIPVYLPSVAVSMPTPFLGSSPDSSTNPSPNVSIKTPKRPLPKPPLPKPPSRN